MSPPLLCFLLVFILLVLHEYICFIVCTIVPLYRKLYILTNDNISITKNRPPSVAAQRGQSFSKNPKKVTTMNDENAKSINQLEEALQLCKDFKELDFKELLESPEGGNNHELLD